jgi:peptidoglycan/xylan/chitin deacetylase (PgdA/CDA1 family)
MTEKNFVVTVTFVLSILVSFHLVYAEQYGSIAVNIMYTNGDRADYSPISMKIYQDTNQTPYRIIESITGNPFNIISLPLGHQYKIETYANGMYASTSYVDLENTQQNMNVNIPLPGGMRVNVLYNDGQTPVANSYVDVRSVDNKTWASGLTDTNGQTLRFWIEPTTSQSDHYTIDVKIGQHLLFTSAPVFLLPGISQEIKVITPWPPLVNSLITVKVYNNQSKLVLPSDGRFAVDILDYQGKKIMESPVNARGEADFYNLKVGDYDFQAINLQDNSTWGNSHVTIDGTQMNFIVEESQTEISQPQIPQIPAPQIPNFIGCNCVAFRLDNVQDYWLDNVQTSIIDTFQKKDASLTIGIIGKVFGNDSKLVNDIRTQVNANGGLEVAINGWSFEDFTLYNETYQKVLLEQSKSKLGTVLGTTPVVFVPPYGKANADTFYAMQDSGIDYISASADVMPPTNLLGTMHSFPATVFTGNHYLENGTLESVTNDMIMSQIQGSIQKYGFAVVMLNFQDYAVSNGTLKVNLPDSSQMENLGTMIDMIRSNGFGIVKISEISNQTNVTPSIPSWIKFSANSWSENKTSNHGFLVSIQYMVKQNIVNAPITGEQITMIPSWVKNNAKWWATGLISDDEFTNGIEFLIKHGIIS